MTMTNWKYCTPEQGKRLVELGIEAGEFTFVYYKGDTFVVRDVRLYSEDPECSIICPAYCVSELGVLLPEKRTPIWLNGGVYSFTIGDSDWSNWRQYNTEAQARAEMLIHLLENNHVTAADCNKRLREANG